MKNLFIFTITLLFTQFLWSQELEDNIIKFTPDETNGSLILNPNLGANYWLVEVFNKKYNENSSYDEILLDKYTLIGKNYSFFPESFIKNPNNFIRVTAYCPGATYVEEKPIATQVLGWDPEDMTLAKTWTCNGPTYAYSISQFVYSGNAHSMFSIEPAFKANAVTGENEWYYQYFSESEWLTLISTNNLLTSNICYNQQNNFCEKWCNYYSIYNYNDLTLNWGAQKVIRIPNNSSYPYKDKNGNKIYSNYVFGLRKALGPWCGGNSGNQECLTKNDILTGSMAGSSISDVIVLLNSVSPYFNECLMPELECWHQGSKPTVYKPKPGQDGYLQIKDSVVFVDSLFNYHEHFDIINGENWINFLSLIGFSFSTGEIFNLSKEELYDNEGQVIHVPVHLSPGLYNLVFGLEDGTIYVTTIEKTGENPCNTLSNFFNATIFPVPITSNDFNIHMSATKDLQVNYKLSSLNGDQIYENRYVIREGATESIKVNPDREIPTGILINTFTFEDGSITSFLTTKSN